MFNVKPSTVPTRLIHELYAHTRAAHPERFLGAETPRRANIPQHLAHPRRTGLESGKIFECFLKLGSFARSHLRAGYICYALLRY